MEQNILQERNENRVTNSYSRKNPTLEITFIQS